MAITTGPCDSCNSAFHKNKERRVRGVSCELHSAICCIAVLKVLIAFVDGTMSVNGNVKPEDNTPIEQYFSSVETYINNGNRTFGLGWWNLICSLAELKWESATLRDLATQPAYQTLCKQHNITPTWDYKIELLARMGLPMSASMAGTRIKENTAKQTKMTEQASAAGKQIRKDRTMQTKVSDRNKKAGITAEAKNASILHHKALLGAHMAEVLGSRDYGDSENEDAATLAHLGMVQAAPTMAKKGITLVNKMKKVDQEKGKRKGKLIIYLMVANVGRDPICATGHFTGPLVQNQCNSYCCGPL